MVNSSQAMIYFKAFFFLERCENRNCHWMLIVILGLFLPLAICEVGKRGHRGEVGGGRVWTQLSSVNRGH